MGKIPMPPPPPELSENLTEEEVEQLYKKHEKLLKKGKDNDTRSDNGVIEDANTLSKIPEVDIRVDRKPKRRANKLNISKEVKDRLIEWLAQPEDERISRDELLYELGLTPELYTKIIKNPVFQAEYNDYMEIQIFEKRSKIMAEHLKKAEKGDTSAIDLYYRKYEGWDPKSRKSEFTSINLNIKIMDFEGNLIKKIQKGEI